MAIQYTNFKWTICKGSNLIVDDKTGEHIVDTDHLSDNGNINAALICDAVNNTAGKGIDPNAVPELLKVLGIISQHAYDDDTPKGDILADFDNMRGLAINAIKAAELK